jgi:putative N6-adenine-specific DNA methylase
MENIRFVAKTLAGLESILAEELIALGATNVLPHRRSVSFSGDKQTLYKANLWSRTALYILQPITRGRVQNKEDLYQLSASVAWEEIFGPDKSIIIHAVSNSLTLRHSKFTSLVVKDAIVDRFRKRIGLRPPVDRENADIYIDVHLMNEQCTISLNTSGKPLYIRGYEKQTGEAPLNDLLAAGMLSLSGWTHDQALFDPFCGSGTILIEAAMKASNIPAGIHRPGFSFMNFLDYNRREWIAIRNEALTHQKEVALNLYGSEIDEPTYKLLESNIRRSKLSHLIKVQNEDFFNSSHKQENGIIITNPPYGERLKPDDIINFYSEIGKRFKFFYPNNKVCILSSNIQGIKNLGFRYNNDGDFLNGKIPVRLISFSVYPDSEIQ